MDSFEANIRNYWNYYLELESELVQTKRYVEFSEINKGVFSIEFLKLYQAICSEIDVVGKYIASFLDKDFDNKNKGINNWWFILQNKLCVSTDVNNYYNPSKIHLNVRAVKVFNYLMGKEYSPWKGYEVEEYKNKKGVFRLKLKNGSSTPKWWSDYNSVKHHRTEKTNGCLNFSKANLNNVCESIAALYILELAVIELSANSKIVLERFCNESQLFERTEFAASVDINTLFL